MNEHRPAGVQTRRAVLGTLAAAAVGGPLMWTQAAPAAAAPVLMWSPNPTTHGLNAFEGIEDDRAGSHPGVRHIYVDSSANYRFDMHLADRDGSDRQRNEVKGMRTASGQIIDMMFGETWRMTYDMFIPSSLKGTTSFTHIFQLKMPGTGTTPLVTISLQRTGTTEYLALRGYESGVTVGRVPLAPLKNHWFSVDMTFLIHNSGQARFIVRDGATTVLDASANIDIWLGDRIRPKWGIYRSLSDSSQLANTYLLLRNMRAYRGAGSIPSSPTPTTASPKPTTASPKPTATTTTTPAPSGTWAPGVAYPVGARVTYAGQAYSCLQAHTAQIGWEPPNTPALWARV